MNEPLFENRHQRDKKTAIEITKFLIFQTKLIKAVYIIAAITGVLTLITFFVQKRQFSDLSISIFTYVYAALLMALMYVVLKNSNVPKEQVCEEAFSVNETQIEWSLGGYTSIYSIGDIGAFYETENYIVILPKKRCKMFPALRKDGFTVGNSEEFINLLKKNKIQQTK